MGNFNAGAIEATLTLDRSTFTKELKAAQVQARAFEKNRITLGVDLDYIQEFAGLQAVINNADGTTINVGVDLEGTEEISELIFELDALRDEVVNVTIDIDGLEDALELGPILQSIPDETVNVKVDTDKGSVRNLIAGQRALNGMRFAIAGVAGLLPAFVPAIAGLTAVVGGLAGALGIAGAGLGVFALVAIPALKGFKDALKAAKGDISKLPPEMQKLAQAQDAFKQSQMGLAASAGVYTVLANGYNLLATVLSQSKPVIEAVSLTLGQIIARIDEWAKSPAFKEVVAFLVAEFGPVMTMLTATIGNLIKTFGYLTRAFQPFTKELLGGLVAMTAGWARWADSLSTSDKFKDFLDYAAENGPKVAKFFVAIGAALINLGVALAPIGGPILDALTGFFGFIAKMPPDLLGTLVVGLAAAIVAFQALSAAVAITNLVLAANPIVLVIVLIVALVAAIMYLWKTNEGFRNVVITVWNAIKAAVSATVGFITGTVVPALVAAFNWVMSAVKAVWSVMVTVWNAISAVVMAVVGGIVGVVTTNFNLIKTIITAVVNGILGTWRAFWGTFGGVIKAGIALVVAIWNLGFSVMLAFVRGIWNGITALIKVAINLAKSTIATGLNLIKTNMTSIWNGIKAITSGVWAAIKFAIINPFNAAKSAVSGILNSIKNFFAPAWGAIKSVTSSAWQSLVDIIKGRIQAAKDSVASAVGGIKAIFSGAGSWLYSAGQDIIRGLLSGIESMIGAVTSKLQALTAKIPKVKGPEQRDKNLLKPAGKWIMGGLISEIETGIEQVLGMMSNMTDLIPNSVNMNMEGAGTPQLVTPGATGVATVAPLTKDEFIAGMMELIAEIRKNTQPLIGEYHDAHKSAEEIAKEWWFATKGRGI